MSVTGAYDPGRDLNKGAASGSAGQAAGDSGSTRVPDPNVEGNGGGEEEEEEDEDDDEEDKEPNLKYTRLTSRLSSAHVYRSGDSTSNFQVSGDKMIVGTHNGNVHVLSVASLQSLRIYRAHSSSITAISVSPFSPSIATPALEQTAKSTSTSQSTPVKSASVQSASALSPKSPRTVAVPLTPSNSIYIATASIDGHVCVSSLVDPKDVTLRNYARPVQAVALSPQFKNDRTYLSGGTAGSLIMTVGGRAGVSSDANTNSSAAAASGWLGAIGLGANTGRDTILHSGEGSISTIKWSLTGRYVVWVNEQGSKIMRSNIHLESAEVDLAWKRIAHVPKPNRRSWEDMAGVWKARAEWIDEKCLEYPEDSTKKVNGPTNNGSSLQSQTPTKEILQKRIQRLERLLIGWGDTVWMVHVTSPSHGAGKAEIVHQCVFPDGVVSGLTLYTPSLLLVLVYRTRDDNDNPIPANLEGTPKKGTHRRQNGLPPDLRLIDLESPNKDEVEVEGLTVSRFESLSTADYNMSTTFVPSVQIQQASQKGALEVIGGGIWDVSANVGMSAVNVGMNAVNVGMSATRLFSSGASVLSGSSEGDKTSLSATTPSSLRGTAKTLTSAEVLPSMSKSGLKIFIQSPYDCVLAIRRDLSDRLGWLLEHERYKDAWHLIDHHPEIVSSSLGPDSHPSTPTRSDQSLQDFFADDSSSEVTQTTARAHNSTVEKEKRRIGDLWVQQLVTARDWVSAGATAGKVLGSTSSWEHWILAFAHAGKFDEITPYVPSEQLKPPLPSLVFEAILGHYISQDRVRLRELLEQWSPSLFDVPVITDAIETQLDTGDVREDSVEEGVKGRDWQILLDCLAKLYLADSRPNDALRCYIRTQHADAALVLIRDYQLIGAISDSIYLFITLRLSREQLAANGPLTELEKLSSEPIHLLISAAIQGIIHTSTVVSQLEAKGPRARPFLFYYIRALWRGDTSSIDDVAAASGSASRATSIRRSRFEATVTAETTSKALLAPHGDLAVSLFADYSRPLLSEYLKSSQDYTYEHASAICERYNYIPELVYLLSATGQTKRALHLIIDELGDVMMAINFAKEVDDESLWGDLLNYSMNEPGRPAFIRGLLEEVGTSIDPVELVRRIPEGLEIEGLKHGLGRLVRESEIMSSISEGAAKVLRSEVVGAMENLKKGRTRGVVFDVIDLATDPTADGMAKPPASETRRGYCMMCNTAYTNPLLTNSADDNGEYLIGFPCGHIFHLACLLDTLTNETNKERVEILQKQLTSNESEGPSSNYSDSRVGNKMAHVQMIKNLLGVRGCPACGVVAENPQQVMGSRE